jgi:hypothetical protein
MKNKIYIGVLVYSKIGTDTSILLDEFKFFNNFQKINEDCEFIFISLSPKITKSIQENSDLLEFPIKIINIYNKGDFYKLNNLSGAFSYMTRMSFFGGEVNKPTIFNYDICSYVTNELNLPLFIRTPDSEYPYYDYKNLIHVRCTAHSKELIEKFIEKNGEDIKKMPEKYINYDNVYFLANGSSKIYDWVPDIAYYDIHVRNRILDPIKISKNTFYIPDNILFNLDLNYKRYNYLEKKSTVNKFIFIGYINGSVAYKRKKILKKIFAKNTKHIPTDIISPGANLLEIDRPDVNLIDGKIKGDKFFETLNSYLAYIFIGKGNPINKYINKTVYDCISARCPIIVYSHCDKSGLIFEDKEFYFSNEDELLEIYNKLQDPLIRENWIDRQHKEIHHKLKTLMDPIFLFNEVCKPKKEKIKIDYEVNSLFR